MKKVIFVLVVVVLVSVGFVLTTLKDKYSINQLENIPITPTKEPLPTPTPEVTSTSKSLFVPYWSLNQNTVLPTDQYDKFIYFGVLGNSSGIVKNDPGYSGLAEFSTLLNKKKESILAIRMVDHQTNTSVLADLNAQNRIIDDSIAQAKQYNFQGLLLDLELTNTFSTSVESQLNVFVQQFYTQTKLENLRFYITMYGDTFYTKRPYDVAALAKNADGVMIMAYDLHKAAGEPGPNFPLTGKEKYGYDLTTLLADFTQVVEPAKLTVIFGMYGYDWAVDEKKRPIRTAETLSLNDIKKKFLGKCTWQDCTVTRDDISKETEVDYVTSEMRDNFAYLYYHIVWFEDEVSAQVKTQYLLENGVGNVAYWAWGYF